MLAGKLEKAAALPEKEVGIAPSPEITRAP
jgi:hypothetical protein